MTLLAALLSALLWTPSQSEPKKEPVNLIPLLDGDLDSVVGDWSVEGGKLHSPKRSRPPRMHLLQIPYVPPEQYDLTLLIESKGPYDPKGDTTSVDLGLPWGDVRPTVVLDGWDGTVRGISLVDGKNANENETTARSRIFTDGTPRTLVYSVRKTGITVTLDGKPLIEWKGEAKRLASEGAYQDLPDRRTPYLAAWIGYVFHKIELTPVTGTGSPITARRTKSRLVGGGGGVGFDDSPAGPAILVGLQYSIIQWGQGQIVKTVQPLYRTDEGTLAGRMYGNPRSEVQELVARRGYAVGAIVAKGGARVDGLKLVFMKIGDKGLDPQDRYESEWLGGRGGGPETTLGGDGVPIVGVWGRAVEDLDCVGVVQGEVPGAILDPARALSERLKDPDAAVRMDLCAKLGLLGVDALPALDALMDLLQNDPAIGVRREAALALGQIGPPAAAAVPLLLEKLRKGEGVEPAACAAALGALGPAARPGIPALSEALEDRDGGTRAQACRALARLEAPDRPAARMIHVLLHDLLKEPDVRPAVPADAELWIHGTEPDRPELGTVWPVLRSLVELGPLAVPALAGSLKADEPASRGVAAALLAMIGPEARAALPLLLESLEDKDPGVRRVAVRAVQEVDAWGPGVPAALKKAARDDDERVRLLAREALDRLARRSLRLKVGDRFSLATRSRMKSESVDPARPHKTDLELEYRVEFEVVWPAELEEPVAVPDLPYFESQVRIFGTSPSGSFRTLSTLVTTDGPPSAVAQRCLESCRKSGWTLEGAPSSPDPGLVRLVLFKKGERCVIEIGRLAETKATVALKVQPLRLLAVTTLTGSVEVRGICTKLRAKGVDGDEKLNVDWDETQNPSVPGGDGRTAAGLKAFVQKGLRFAIDGRGQCVDPQWPLDMSLMFPGAALGMPGSLPEDDRTRPASWPAKGQPGDRLEHHFQREDDRELVIASKATGDETTGTAVTHFDPRTGLPSKSTGSLSFTIKDAARGSVEFETTFTRKE